MMYRLDESRITGRNELREEFEDFRAITNFHLIMLCEKIEKLESLIKEMSKENK